MHLLCYKRNRYLPFYLPVFAAAGDDGACRPGQHPAAVLKTGVNRPMPSKIRDQGCWRESNLRRPGAQTLAECCATERRGAKTERTVPQRIADAKAPHRDLGTALPGTFGNVCIDEDGARPVVHVPCCFSVFVRTLAKVANGSPRSEIQVQVTSGNLDFHRIRGEFSLEICVRYCSTR